MKEAIRRVVWVFGELGLAPEEFEATTGTLKHKFLIWLYGDGVPMFDMQLPSYEDTSRAEKQ